jgi:hypothetical protein
MLVASGKFRAALGSGPGGAHQEVDGVLQRDE